MGITNWPFRANFSRTEALHDMTERPKLCISVQVSRAHLPSPALYSITRGCADFILCRCNIFTGQKSVGWITWGFIPPVADLGVFCIAAQHTRCECCTKIILPSLQETCHGIRVGDFQKEQQHLCLPGPDWVADLYQWGLSQPFGLALSAQAGGELKCEREFCGSCLASSPSVKQKQPELVRGSLTSAKKYSTCTWLGSICMISALTLYKSETLIFQFWAILAQLCFVLCSLRAPGTCVCCAGLCREQRMNSLAVRGLCKWYFKITA